MKFSKRGLGATYSSSRKEESFWSDVYQEANSRVGAQLSSCTSPQVTSILPRVVFTQGGKGGKKEEDENLGKARETFEEQNVDDDKPVAKTKYAGISFERQGILQGGREIQVDQKADKRKKWTNGESTSEECTTKLKVFAIDDAPILQTKSPSPSPAFYKQPLQGLSDSCLLELGKGRTGHPAARFGMRCGGKLSRASKFL